MFENVLVGIDGREGGRDALGLAAALAPGQKLTLAHVFHGDTHFQPFAVPPGEQEQLAAAALLERERETAGIDAQLLTRASASVGRGLHELAEQLGADLLVVGSSRRSLLGRVLLGDETRAALNGAPCAVAIAPAGFAARPAVMREIGVGYDGLPESEHALRVGRELASQLGARLSACEVVSLPSMALTGPAPIDGSTIVKLVDGARERIAALDGVEPHAVYGQGAEELAIYSASVDLLVVGSRGFGPLGRLVHGSTSNRVSRLARSPLLVLVRAAGRE